MSKNLDEKIALHFVFFRLFCLLYADDTILMAESPGELQRALDAVNEYCRNWSLTVNVDKAKIVIFSKGKIKNTFKN